MVTAEVSSTPPSTLSLSYTHTHFQICLQENFWEPSFHCLRVHSYLQATYFAPQHVSWIEVLTSKTNARQKGHCINSSSSTFKLNLTDTEGKYIHRIKQNLQLINSIWAKSSCFFLLSPSETHLSGHHNSLQHDSPVIYFIYNQNWFYAFKQHWSIYI